MPTCVVSRFYKPGQMKQNSLGFYSESDQDNMNQRGFLVQELQQGGTSEQILNSHRPNEFNAHSSLNLFGGQHQMNGQHPGLLQPLQQQQSGFSDTQNMPQQIMLRKMQEMQRRKSMRQEDTRQHNSVTQAFPFVGQVPGSDSHGIINGTLLSESFWPGQGQAQRSMGFVHQQTDQSLYGVPVSSSGASLNPFYTARNEVLACQMPTHANLHSGNHYAEIPEQFIIHNGTSVSRQGLSDKGLFEQPSGQGSHSWISTEQIQHLKYNHQTGSEQMLIGPSDMTHDEPATEAAASHGSASLDPDEEKFLFGSDEKIWDAFGSDINMVKGASSQLGDNEFASGFPSLQSGSWSALMQSAVAETSSSGMDLQEEWMVQQTPTADASFSNTSAMSFGVDGGKMKDNHQRNTGFQHHGTGSPYEPDERAHIKSSNIHTRVRHEEIGHGIWRDIDLPNTIVDPGPIGASMGSPQTRGESFIVNSAGATPNISNMLRGSHHQFQLPSISHQLNQWKLAQSPVNSKGSGNSGRPLSNLNKGSQASESSFNSSDKDDLKMHEIESRSKRENSIDSYHSSSSRQVVTGRSRENASSDAVLMTSAQQKFQYYPVGVDAEMPYRKQQGSTTQATPLQLLQGLRGQDQWNPGQTIISGQAYNSSAEMGKEPVPDLEGITNGSRDMIGGQAPNMFASFNRRLSASVKAFQPSRDMLELLHKVDQSRDRGTAGHSNFPEHNLSSQMPERGYSDGSVRDFKRSQSSNSQGLGLNVGSPSQRLPLPDRTFNPLTQAHFSPGIRDKGQALLPSLPLFQGIPQGGNNNRIGNYDQSASETLAHTMAANLSSSMGADFPNSRSLLQNHQTLAVGSQLNKVESLGKESIINVLPENPTASQMNLEAFGRSLISNGFYQNNASMNQMSAMRNTDNDLGNRATKRLKRSDILDAQLLASWPKQADDIMGDVSTCLMEVPPGDSQSNVPSNSMISVKAEHSYISPQKGPSWFDRYGTLKNSHLSPEKVGMLKSTDQIFSVSELSSGLETHGQASPAADASQVSALWKSSVSPSLALQQSSPKTAGIQDLPTLRPKKHRRTTVDLHPWLVEVSGSFKNLQGICTGAMEWSRASNLLMEKVDEDGDVIQDKLPIARSKRRLIFTTLLMQQLLRPPPAAIMSVKASSVYESVVYYAARLALGDACNLFSSAQRNSSISLQGANCLSERTDDHHLSKAIEDFKSKAGKLEDDFLRLDKTASILDLRLDFQDLEKISIINRFAGFHGLAPPSRPLAQRYVTAVQMPANLPDSVHCLSL